MLQFILYNCPMLPLKEYFLLDPEIVFLNHGSFGAAPKPVTEAYQNWQLRLERQPVLFLGRELDGLLRESRIALGEYLNADAGDLVYIPNATHGMNIIAHSLQLRPGDEILTTDHEYGACDYTWEFICKKGVQNTFVNLFRCQFIPRKKLLSGSGQVSPHTQQPYI